MIFVRPLWYCNSDKIFPPIPLENTRSHEFNPKPCEKSKWRFNLPIENIFQFITFPLILCATQEKLV